MTAIFVDGIGAGAAPSGIFSQLQVARPRRGRCRSRRPTWHRGADPYAVRSYDAVVPAYGAAFDKASWAPVASWLAGRGLDVLAIGFRGYGRSRGTDAHALFKDVLAARRRRLPCSD
jgi:alpha-beta hydrolase superfamily lysophospholipase